MIWFKNEKDIMITDKNGNKLTGKVITDKDGKVLVGSAEHIANLYDVKAEKTDLDNKEDVFEIGSGLQKDINPATGKPRISAKSVDPNSGITEDRANQLIKDKVGSLQIGDKTFNNTTEAINEMGTEFGSLINDLPSKDDLDTKQDKLITNDETGISIQNNVIFQHPILTNTFKLPSNSDLWKKISLGGAAMIVQYGVITDFSDKTYMLRNVVAVNYNLKKIYMIDEGNQIVEVDFNHDYSLQIPEWLFYNMFGQASLTTTSKENNRN